MPQYVYRCQECKQDFEVRHGMSYEDQTCIFCSSSKVFKLPQGNLTKAKTNTTHPGKPGKLVKEYIEEVKQEVKKEKHDLKKKEM